MKKQRRSAAFTPAKDSDVDPQASLIGIEILKSARRWVASRVMMRRVLDSKSATKAQVDKAQKDNIQAAEELEGLVMRLERYLHNSGKRFPTGRGRQAGGGNFPWREMFGMVAAGARAVESALGAGKPGVIDAQVIDVEPPSKK